MLSGLNLYKTVAIVVFLVIGLFVSDFRAKNVTELIRQPFLGIMKSFYYIGPLSYTYFLFTAENLGILDFFGLILMILGTIIVIFAKNQLGQHHSWAGYSRTDRDTYVDSGIYAYIRHPLYLEIIIAVCGSGFVVFQRASRSWTLFSVYIISFIFVFTFILYSSYKETEFLKAKLGEPFIRYTQRVPALIPRLWGKESEKNQDGD